MEVVGASPRSGGGSSRSLHSPNVGVRIAGQRTLAQTQNQVRPKEEKSMPWSDDVELRF